MTRDLRRGARICHAPHSSCHCADISDEEQDTRLAGRAELQAAFFTCPTVPRPAQGVGSDPDMACGEQQGWLPRAWTSVHSKLPGPPKQADAGMDLQGMASPSRLPGSSGGRTSCPLLPKSHQIFCPFPKEATSVNEATGV